MLPRSFTEGLLGARDLYRELRAHRGRVASALYVLGVFALLLAAEAGQALEAMRGER